MPSFVNALPEHLRYLADARRLAAYAAALGRVVRPGSAVLDLGSGTGVLGVLACRAGARRVYAIERTGLAELVRDVARANGCADRLVCLRGESTEVELPERVDVVVADQLAAFGLGAGLLESFADAARRHLAPGGATVPRRLELWMAAVSHPRTAERLASLRRRPQGVELAPVLEPATHTGHVVELEPEAVLTSAACVAAVDLPPAAWGRTVARARLRCERAGRVHGLGAWFAADLDATTRVTNAPAARDRLDREQLLFPLPELELAAGDELELQTRLDLATALFTWEVSHVRGGVARPAGSGSTFRGVALSREDLERARPGRAVVLSPRGRARRDLLAACDGRRTVAELEELARAQHPELFADTEAAAAFVRQVLDGAEA